MRIMTEFGLVYFRIVSTYFQKKKKNQNKHPQHLMNVENSFILTSTRVKGPFVSFLRNFPQCLGVLMCLHIYIYY